jgi:hypothetical protein
MVVLILIFDFLIFLILENWPRFWFLKKYTNQYDYYENGSHKCESH